MEHDKPKVTIDYAEYIELLKNSEGLNNAEITEAAFSRLIELVITDERISMIGLRQILNDSIQKFNVLNARTEFYYSDIRSASLLIKIKHKQ